jgi:amidase
MVDEELAFAPALELAALVRDGQVSSRELVELYLARIDRLDPTLNSFITVAHEQARAAADRADATSGTGEDRPPFHGVPISIKDLTDTAGLRTTLGSAAFRDRVPAVDAPVVRRLRQAGFVVLGKTNTPEFGFGSTDPVGYGPCRNPWDTERTSGGSSGGAAVAVAAGLSPLSHASDAGGSIRMPASFCGVVGLKPSRGRVSTGPIPNMLAQDGPISRTVRDAAAMLDAIAGYDAGAPFWAAPPSRPFLDELGRPPRALRVAFTADVPLAQSRPESVAAVEDVAALLDTLGHQVAAAAPHWPSADPLIETAKKLAQLAGEADDAASGPGPGGAAVMQHGAPRALYSVFGARFLLIEDQVPSPELLDPLLQTFLHDLHQLSLKEYLAIESGMYLAAEKTLQFFEGYDILVTPTVPYPAPLVSEVRNPDSIYSAEGLFSTCTWNMTGQPAITLPLSAHDGGLPLGVQLVARPGEEATLLQVAAQLEEARPWSKLRPPGF